MHLFSTTRNNSERIQRNKVTSGRELVEAVAGGCRSGHRWEACEYLLLFTSFLYLPLEFCVLSMY